MRQPILYVVIAALACLPAAAAKESAVLGAPSELAHYPIEVLPRASWLTDAFCHCTGDWSPAPELYLVAMNTGESYATVHCDSGRNPARDRLEPVKPKRKLPKGTHLGAVVMNDPRPLRQAGSVNVCTITVKRRTGP